MGWPFPVLNSTRELLWFEISKMLVAVFKNYLQVAYDCVDGQCLTTCNLHYPRVSQWRIQKIMLGGEWGLGCR